MGGSQSLKTMRNKKYLMKELIYEDNWVGEFSNLLMVSEVWNFFKTEAVKSVMNEMQLRAREREGFHATLGE